MLQKTPAINHSPQDLFLTTHRVMSLGLYPLAMCLIHRAYVCAHTFKRNHP